MVFLGHKSQFVYDDIHCNWSYDNSCFQPIYIRWICIKAYMWLWVSMCVFYFNTSPKFDRAHTLDWFYFTIRRLLCMYCMCVCVCVCPRYHFFQLLYTVYNNEMFNIFITSNVLSRIQVSFCRKYVQYWFPARISCAYMRFCYKHHTHTHTVYVFVYVYCLTVSHSPSHSPSFFKFAFVFYLSFRLVLFTICFFQFSILFVSTI